MADEPALPFETAEDFAAWIAARSGPDGVWLRVPMKASGNPGIGYAEALQVALAHGWIDGQRKGDDGTGYWLQRFTPRRARSITPSRRLRRSATDGAAGGTSADMTQPV